MCLVVPLDPLERSESQKPPVPRTSFIQTYGIIFLAFHWGFVTHPAPPLSLHLHFALIVHIAPPVHFALKVQFKLIEHFPLKGQLDGPA